MYISKRVCIKKDKVVGNGDDVYDEGCHNNAFYKSHYMYE